MIEIKLKIRLKAKNHLIVKIKIEHSIRVLRDENKQIRREPASLSNAPKGGDPPSSMLVNEEGKGSKIETLIEPINPNCRKVHFG